MNFTLRLAKVLGNPDESGWSQIHQFTPNDPKKLQNRGSIFCLITLHYKKEEVTQTIERVAFGREVISRIHEEYYGKTKNTPFTALKNAVGKVSEEFSDDVLEKLEIGAISVVENVIYAAVCGGSSILIYRDGILAEIISKEKDKENLQGVVSASGYPKSEDVLIIANNNFLENVPKGTLKASVQSKDIAEASESLAPKIHAVDESGTNACIFIYFEEGYEQVSQITAAYEKEPTKDSFEAEKPDKKFIGSLMDKLPKKRLYIRKEMGDLEDMQRRKVAASVGLILLVLLGSSIFFGVKQKKQSEEKELYLSKITSARHELDEAMQIAGLNSQRARELFQSSDTKVKEMISLGIEDEEIQKLSQELESARRDILGEYDTEAEFYLDLTLLTDEFNGEEVAVSDEVIYILDKDSEKIVSVVIENKKTNIVAGPSSLDSPSDIAAYAGRVFVLTNEGITEVDNADVELSDFTTGNNWILSFASNIYVLDKDTSQIWKYSSLGESFTGPTKWLSEDQNTDFSDVISWAIDGNIWALKENADILKFTQGVEQNFSADGIYPQLENPKKIFSDENQEFLYLLEPDKTRIVVTSKDGEYKKQYISNKISDADEFAVSEKEGMILLLDSGVLYSIKL